MKGPRCEVCGVRDLATKVYQQDALGFLIPHEGICQEKRKEQVRETQARHSSRGTARQLGNTPEVLDFVRLVCGPITLDLASNPKANKLVRADRYYQKIDPCPDAPHLADNDVVWCNPPGPVAEVKRFFSIWDRCMGMAGNQGGFLIFNMDHWRALEPVYGEYTVVIWCKRLKFVGAPSQYNHPSSLVLCTRAGIGTEHGPVVSWI